jgi:hypothetical protein
VTRGLHYVRALAAGCVLLLAAGVVLALAVSWYAALIVFAGAAVYGALCFSAARMYRRSVYRARASERLSWRVGRLS